MTIKEILNENPLVFKLLSDSDAAKEMNRLQFPGDRRLSILQITASLGTGVSDRLIQSLEESQNKTVLHVLKLLESGGDVNVNHPVTRGLLDSFSSDKRLPLTLVDAEQIKSLASNRNSYASLKGLTKVKEGHVAMARRL